MPGRPPRRQSSRGPEALATLLTRVSPDDGARRGGAPLPPRAWYDAVGDRVARRTRPIRLERKVLTVRAATAVWAQELSFLAPAIVKRLTALGFFAAATFPMTGVGIIAAIHGTSRSTEYPVGTQE